MGWWGIAWTLSRCALNASAGIAKRKQFGVPIKSNRVPSIYPVGVKSIT